MSPHETLFLESTHNVDIHLISNNDFVKFQTWDFGGDMNLQHGVQYGTKVISTENILRGCSTLVYVIDAQEDDYEDSLPKLVETIIFAFKINPKIHFEVFLHKIDGDLMPDEIKSERQQGIQNYVSTELSDVSNGEILVSYYLTSIYDHSVLEAFSKVLQHKISFVRCVAF
jgi:Ras-related GTP-binding protein C/D